MSQPPDAYNRQYNFSNWSITHPGEPHQGAKIDLELNEIKESLDQTQARLNEIQRDDGFVRPEALTPGIDAYTTELALQAAQKTYADNLASVADKAAARANLQIGEHYPSLLNNILPVWSDANVHPTFTITNAVQVSQDAGQGPQPHYAPLATSSYVSRAFRASVLFGTLRDYATDWADAGGSPVPDVTPRVDNVSFALLNAGTTGRNNDGGTASVPGGFFTNNYNTLARMPSASNPLVTLTQLIDAVQTLRLEGAGGGGGSTGPWEALTLDQVNAIGNSEAPDVYNPVITQSALSTALATKADASHYHEISEVNGLTAELIGKASATHTHAQGDIVGLATALAGKAAASHTHAQADITGLTASLAAKADTTDTGLAKAWVSFDGSTTTPTIKASKNVTSVTKNATGVYTINFTSAFADANYCWTGGGRNPGNNFGLIVSQSNTYKTQTTTALQVTTRGDDGSLQDATWVNVVVFR